jgi:hypothetical protein
MNLLFQGIFITLTILNTKTVLVKAVITSHYIFNRFHLTFFTCETYIKFSKLKESFALTNETFSKTRQTFFWLFIYLFFKPMEFLIKPIYFTFIMVKKREYEAIAQG